MYVCMNILLLFLVTFSLLFNLSYIVRLCPYVITDKNSTHYYDL